VAAKGGLGKWFSEEWVNIGAPKKRGKYQPCGRPSSKSGSGYPKCVPVKKAAKMTEEQKKSAVTRKRSVSNVGPKPTNVSTFRKRSSK
jgi:hypothetical protein